MDPATAIILADALATITFRLIEETRKQPGTAEEQKAQLEALRVRLADTLAKVEAYQPGGPVAPSD